MAVAAQSEDWRGLVRHKARCGAKWLRQPDGGCRLQLGRKGGEAWFGMKFKVAQGGIGSQMAVAAQSGDW